MSEKLSIFIKDKQNLMLVEPKPVLTQIQIRFAHKRKHDRQFIPVKETTHICQWKIKFEPGKK